MQNVYRSSLGIFQYYSIVICESDSFSFRSLGDNFNDFVVIALVKVNFSFSEVDWDWDILEKEICVFGSWGCIQ